MADQNIVQIYKLMEKLKLSISQKKVDHSNEFITIGDEFDNDLDGNSVFSEHLLQIQVLRRESSDFRSRLEKLYVQLRMKDLTISKAKDTIKAMDLRLKEMNVNSSNANLDQGWLDSCSSFSKDSLHEVDMFRKICTTLVSTNESAETARFDLKCEHQSSMQKLDAAVDSAKQLRQTNFSLMNKLESTIDEINLMKLESLRTKAALKSAHDVQVFDESIIKSQAEKLSENSIDAVQAQMTGRLLNERIASLEADVAAARRNFQLLEGMYKSSMSRTLEDSSETSIPFLRDGIEDKKRTVESALNGPVEGDAKVARLESSAGVSADFSAGATLKRIVDDKDANQCDECKQPSFGLMISCKTCGTRFHSTCARRIVKVRPQQENQTAGSNTNAPFLLNRDFRCKQCVALT